MRLYKKTARGWSVAKLLSKQSQCKLCKSIQWGSMKLIFAHRNGKAVETGLSRET